jgi:predicted nucleic acid-binding protein
VVTSVDTNILLDVGFDQTSDSAISERALRVAEAAGDVIISVITYAQIAGKFPQAANLAQFLDSLGIRVTPLDPNTAFLAGQFMREYKLRAEPAPASSPTSSSPPTRNSTPTAFSPATAASSQTSFPTSKPSPPDDL